MKSIMLTILGVALFPMMVFAGITISPTSIDYAVGGGGAAIKTSGSGSWTATSDADWITVVKSSGEAGTACTYIVSRNNDADSREGHITIGGNIYTVTQKGCPVELSPASASFGKTGGSGIITVSVDAGVTWTASPSDTWITVTPVSGSGAAELSYTVAAYDAVGSRTGTIRVGSEKFTIVQTGVDITLIPAITSVTKGVCIVPLQVVALTETTWTVKPKASWISILDGGTGRGGSQVLLTVAENPSVEKRTGTVAIGSSIFTIIQDGTDDVNFKILPEVATASPLGAFANVAVYATPDASWTAESMDSWIKITEGEEGAGNGNVKYVTMSNPELISRSGRIKFTPPVYTPELDLYSGLMFWIKKQANIEGNETRQATLSLDTVLDGSQMIGFSGAELPKNDKIDFSFAVSFKLGSLDRLNRLLMLGNGDNARHFYFDSVNKLHYDYGEYPRTVDCVIPSANEWYTLVVTQKSQSSEYEGGTVSVYFGHKGGELSLVHQQGEGSFLQYNRGALPIADCFTLGRTLLPSAGNLQSGQFANVRFWNRALTDLECKQVDTKNELVESKPQGMPDSVKWRCYPLNGNLFYMLSGGLSAVAPACGESVSSFKSCPGKDMVQFHGFESKGNGKILIPNFGSLFDAGCTTNFTIGFPKEENMFPHPIVQTSTKDATYCFWMKIDSMPVSEVNIFERRMANLYLDMPNARNSPYWYESSIKSFYPDLDLINEFTRDPRSYSDALKNYYMALKINENGTLKWVETKGRLENTGKYTFPIPGLSGGYPLSCPEIKPATTKSDTVSSVRLTENEWHLISVVGHGGTSATFYIDGNDVGNISSEVDSYAWVAPVDGRLNSDWGSKLIAYVAGSIMDILLDFEIGGWDGAIDEMVFFNHALSAKQIKAMYTEGLPVRNVYHTVNQGVQAPSITPEQVYATKFGGTTNIALSVAREVNWTAVPSADWLSIVGATSGTGPANILVKVAANSTCDPRVGTVTIGSKTLTVEQEALNCEIEADQTVFPTEAGETGGMGIISVSPEGNGSWTAESDAAWITCYPESGTGSYDVYFFVEDMGTTAASRSGKITIGGKTIEITQRGYDLSIDPQICEVGGNAGAGVIGVAADAGAVWTAIADVPWITIVQTTDKSVHYTYTDNTTGETRIGHINISGEEYELRQTCKLDLNTTVVGKGTVTGGGKYAQGVTVSLKATPANGYEFSHWSGDVVGVESDTSVIMDTVKNVTATFIPEAAAQVLAEKKAAQGGFYTRDQIHNLELGNLVLDVDSATGKARIGVQLQETSDLSNPNWQPVEVTTSDLDVGKDGTVGIKAKATGNGMFYRVVVPKK